MPSRMAHRGAALFSHNFGVAKTAADLNGTAERLDYAGYRLGMLRRSCESTIKVDDVKFLAALLAPVLRLRRRIVAIDSDVVGASLPEPHALPVLEIDCGEYYHVR